MMSVPGNSPPNISQFSHVPITGNEISRAAMTRRPVPESRSSGSE